MKLKGAGVEFTNGDAPGVRLRKCGTQNRATTSACLKRQLCSILALDKGAVSARYKEPLCARSSKWLLGKLHSECFEAE